MFVFSLFRLLITSLLKQRISTQDKYKDLRLYIHNSVALCMMNTFRSKHISYNLLFSTHVFNQIHLLSMRDRLHVSLLTETKREEPICDFHEFSELS